MVEKLFEDHGLGQGRAISIPAERLHRQASLQMANWISTGLSNFWTELKRRREALDVAAGNYSTHQADLESLGILARRQEDWQLRFHAALESAALAWRSRQQSSIKSNALALSLMSEAELSVQLYGQQATANVSKQLERLLQASERQVAAFAAVLGLRADAGNPWGVNAIVDAFIQTLPLDDCSSTLVPIIFEALSERLPQVLQNALPSLEQLLKEVAATAPAAFPSTSDVSSHIPQESAVWAPEGGLVEPVASAQPNAGGAPSSATERFFAKNTAFRNLLAQAAASPGASTNVAAGVAGMNYREGLRETLANWRYRGQQQGYWKPLPAASNAKVFQTSEVLAVASMLQGEDPAPFVQALGGQTAASLQWVIRDQLLSAAAQLGFDAEKTRFAQDEDDAIDLVGMLFDHLVRDNGLPDRGMRMFGKLVLPYVKMVVMDDSLFNSQGHPARRLLDALTEACEGNDGDDAFGREVLDRADRVVDQVVARYQEDQAIFELAAQELRGLLDQQRQRMEIAEKRLAQTLYGRERLKFAQDVAYQALLERTGTNPISDGVWDFMQGYWRNALLQIWLRHGAESRHYRDLLALGDALPRLDAAGAELRSHELAKGFSEQLAALRECVAQSGLLGDAADEAIARLLQSMIMVDVERYIRQPPAAPDLDMDTNDSPEAEFSEADPVLVSRLRKLQPGQRLRLRESDGRETVGKVAWISPLTSRLLIVNRYGTRRLVVSAEELACKISAGEVMVCATEAPMEQAIRRLLEDLQPAAVG